MISRNLLLCIFSLLSCVPAEAGLISICRGIMLSTGTRAFYISPEKGRVVIYIHEVYSALRATNQMLDNLVTVSPETVEIKDRWGADLGLVVREDIISKLRTLAIESLLQGHREFAPWANLRGNAFRRSDWRRFSKSTDTNNLELLSDGTLRELEWFLRTEEREKSLQWWSKESPEERSAIYKFLPRVQLEMLKRRVDPISRGWDWPESAPDFFW